MTIFGNFSTNSSSHCYVVLLCKNIHFSGSIWGKLMGSFALVFLYCYDVFVLLLLWDVVQKKSRLLNFTPSNNSFPSIRKINFINHFSCKNNRMHLIGFLHMAYFSFGLRNRKKTAIRKIIHAISRWQ